MCRALDITWKHSTKHIFIRHIINWFICGFNLRRVKLQEEGLRVNRWVRTKVKYLRFLDNRWGLSLMYV